MVNTSVLMVHLSTSLFRLSTDYRESHTVSQSNEYTLEFSDLNEILSQPCIELIFHSLAAVWNPHNLNKAPSSLFSYSVYSKQYPLLFPTGQNSPVASHFIDWSVSPNLTTATSSTCLLDHNNASLCLHCIYLSLSCVSSRSLYSALYCKY